MPSLRSTLGLAAILIACACNPPPTDPGAPPQNNQGQPQAQGDGPAPSGEGQDQPAATVAKPSELFLGTWALDLNPTQQRQHELLQLAFGDPAPTQAQLAHAQLTPEEQLMVGMVLMGREQHPGDGTDDVLQGLEELSSATLTVTETSMNFAHGDTQDIGAYTVLTDETSTLEIESTTTVDGQPVVERVKVQFEGADRLELWIEGDPMGDHQSFVRQGSSPDAQDEGPPQGDPSQPPPAPPVQE